MFDLKCCQKKLIREMFFVQNAILLIILAFRWTPGKGNGSQVQWLWIESLCLESNDIYVLKNSSCRNVWESAQSKV